MRSLNFILEVYHVCASAILPSCCRFFPSCSVYLQEAIRKKGMRLGLKLGLSRLLRCHPFHPGGYDPVT